MLSAYESHLVEMEDREGSIQDDSPCVEEEIISDTPQG